MRGLPIVVALLALLAPTGAEACRSSRYYMAIVHSKLPAVLPAGMVAVDAELPAELTDGEFRRSGGEARVRRVVRGQVPVRTIRVSPGDGSDSSCSYAFANGRAGLLVGQLRQENGRWVLDPEWVMQRFGYQLEY